MKISTPLAGVILLAAWTLACTNAPDRQHTAPAAEHATPSEAADGGRATAASSAAPSRTPDARDVCALLTGAEIAEVIGVAVERAEKKPNGCDWYANAAAQQRSGADSVRSTFSTLMKQEPKSAEEGVHRMEDILKGVTRAVDPSKPLFAVTIQWEDADRAEAIVKTTVGVVGGGTQGGGLEQIDGLGDRAYAVAAGVLFYVRKGPALLTIGSLGTREQTIALARKVVSRM